MTLAAIAPRQTLKTVAASRAAMPRIQVIFRTMAGGAIVALGIQLLRFTYRHVYEHLETVIEQVAQVFCALRG